MNGDTYFDLDYEALCGKHVELVNSSGALATIAVSEVDDAARFGMVEADADTGQVTGFREKQDARAPGLVNGGVYVLERSLLDTVPAGKVCSLERDVLPRAVAETGKVFAHRFSAGFFDIGTPDSLVEFAEFYERR